MSIQTLPDNTDVVVIGAGPGGYVAAIRAAQHGAEVTLVEKDAYGGTCLNVGCIPSKALITAADLAHQAGNAEKMGVYADVSVNFEEMIGWKDKVVGQLSTGVKQLSKANGVSIIDGTARFLDEDNIQISEAENNQGIVGFENAIIATGSSPVTVPGVEFDGEHILSSTDIFELHELPEKLIIVGAGYIGMELSAALTKLGVEVTVVEMLDRALPGYEEDVASVVMEHAQNLGVEFQFGEVAKGWEATEHGTCLMTESNDSKRFSYYADAVVVAVGRKPCTDTISMENAGIDMNDDGFISTDKYMQTTTDGVFAVGDVTGEPMLAHKASNQGELVADAITHDGEVHIPSAVPAAVFTDPEICTVGMTEAEARAAGNSPITGRMPMRASGRALTMDAPDGFIRIVADGSTGVILGAQAVCSEASELGAELSLAVELKATVTDVASTIHTHPTLGEAVMEAAANARGQAIHTLNE
jgi:dihydrolipoamide dehydrogenase